MSLIIEELEYAHVRRVTVVPDPESVPFVAKMQKAKTRKNKDYFILRATIPKEIVQKTGVKAGEFMFFRAKKAKWYHMMDWKAMTNTWDMLPDDVRRRVALDGLYGQAMLREALTGATNASASLPEATCIQTNQMSEVQWK